MGTLFGARLASAGFPVTLVDVNDTLLATLRREGARCITDDGALRAPVEALRADQIQTGPALWLVFTKSAHTRAALQSIAHLVGPATHFLSLQNGIGHADRQRTTRTAFANHSCNNRGFEFCHFK